MGCLVSAVVRIAKIPVIAGFLLSDTAGARTSIPSPGTRVRVLAPTVLSSRATGRATGILQSLEPDSLRLFRTDRGESLVLPTASVTGLLAGMLIGLVAFEDPSEKGLEALEYGLWGGAIGLVVGGAVGAAVRTEQWEAVPPESWRLGLGFHGNAGLRLAVSF